MVAGLVGGFGKDNLGVTGLDRRQRVLAVARAFKHVSARLNLTANFPALPLTPAVRSNLS